VPDIATVYIAAMAELQESVAVPEPVTLPGVMDPHVRLAGTVSVRVTVPVKPLTGVTLIVDTAEDPTFAAAGEVAVSVKSTKVKVAVAEEENVPLVPVMVTV
jgi:hypothetical protein